MPYLVSSSLFLSICKVISQRTYIPSYNWSPDGRYIAFWLIPESKKPDSANLAVLDTTNLEVVNYCLPGTIKWYGDLPPIWSPNSQQLVMEAEDREDANHNLVILVDIATGWAAQIAENLTPVGWMAKP
jgi:Tol biopolymer transport system component